MSGYGFFDKVEKSAFLVFLGIVFLFSGAVIVTLIAPRFVDPNWTAPSSDYQKQMYEVGDPNVYISISETGTNDIQVVHHLKKGETLMAFKEASTMRIITSDDLQKYVTRVGEKDLKLTSRLLMLRQPIKSMKNFADNLQIQLQHEWEISHPSWKDEGLQKPRYKIRELYIPDGSEAFSRSEMDGLTENWVDQDFIILDEKLKQPYHMDSGVLYVLNPEEFRVSHYMFGHEKAWKVDGRGSPVKGLAELQGKELKFVSRETLIHKGENIYAIEGCWYCHTDQTRTLVQDVILNGSESYPAPPSSANEYIYQHTSFPGTRRIGPDLSRVGVKRPSRDWHKAHFWSPKTESPGSIMPAFHHFFDEDPRGTSKNPYGVPNYKFEAIFQYLMTKGTRITAPTEAWWLGKDPVRTIDIIESRRNMDTEEERK